jgi:hypothetical protein
MEPGDRLPITYRHAAIGALDLVGPPLAGSIGSWAQAPPDPQQDRLPFLSSLDTSDQAPRWRFP